MSYLRDKRLYLSGPIQHMTDINWRVEPKKVLIEKFGLNVFDPAEDPKQQWTELLEQAAKDNDYEAIVTIAKMFVRKDLSKVDESHLVVAYIPHLVPTVGVCHEIINSNNAKKPTLLVTDKTLTHIPVWYYGFIPLEFMFAGWNALFQYLEEVDAGKHKDNNRWDIVYDKI